jgi:CheY-like chemotaxis protein
MSALPAGLRLLLVEDEPIIAMTAEDMLDILGCEVVTTAATLVEALAAAGRGGFQAAVLDINLGGSSSFPVAEMLRSASIPFIFTTGYGLTGGGEAFAEVPVATKPYQIDDLERALLKALAR